jgi:hypothetical protein
MALTPSLHDFDAGRVGDGDFLSGEDHCNPASQNTPMLRRLFANVGMMVPELVPGGRCGKSMVAVVDEFSNFPSAMPTVVGNAL